MSKKLLCVAIFEAKNGKEKDLHNLLISLVQPSRAESGCISYEIYQSEDNPQRFMAHEVFVNQEAFEAHLASNYVIAFQQALPLLLAKPFEAHTQEIT